MDHLVSGKSPLEKVWNSPSAAWSISLVCLFKTKEQNISVNYVKNELTEKHQCFTQNTEPSLHTAMLKLVCSIMDDKCDGLKDFFDADKIEHEQFTRSQAKDRQKQTRTVECFRKFGIKSGIAIKIVQ